jgi:hypothetical protein
MVFKIRLVKFINLETTKMNNKKMLLIVAVLLLITCGNFARLSGNETIRPIQYISLLTIGALLVVLIRLIILKFKK